MVPRLKSTAEGFVLIAAEKSGQGSHRNNPTFLDAAAKIRQAVESLVSLSCSEDFSVANEKNREAIPYIHCCMDILSNISKFMDIMTITREIPISREDPAFEAVQLFYGEENG